MASLQPVTGALGTKGAAHLLRRATFGPTRADVGTFASYTPAQALSILFAATPAPPPPSDPLTGSPWVVPGMGNSEEGKLRNIVKSWSLEQMRTSGNNVTEKITFFLHTHFTSIYSVIERSTALYYQYQLLRQCASGTISVQKLARKLCTDNAMLILLDNRFNESGRPNENFARELLELYTVGKGKQLGQDNYTNYTESDIQAAARVLSGHNADDKYTNIDPETGLPTGIVRGNGTLAARHDAGSKTFSAALGGLTIQTAGPLTNGQATATAALTEVDELIGMIYAQPETARFFCRKIYRFFVYYEITDEVEADIIGPLADTLRSNNYQIRPVLERLFQSQHFYDLDNALDADNTRSAIIKSPLDLQMGMYRFFRIAFPPATDLDLFYNKTYGDKVLGSLQEQGMNLYEPLDVLGYDAYSQAPVYHRNWITVNNLARRYDFAQQLMDGLKDSQNNVLLRLDVVQFVRDNISDPSNARVLVTEIVESTLPEAISTERFDYFLKDLLLDNLSEMNWKIEWNNYLASGNDTGVRAQIRSFFKAVLQSPEYQLM